MNSLEALYPFAVGWMCITLYAIHEFIYLVNNTNRKFTDDGVKESRWDVARRKARNLAVTRIIVAGIGVGLAVEIVWWVLALAMGVNLPI